MTKDDTAIAMMAVNTYVDWGGYGVMLLVASLLCLWTGQAWTSVTYE